MFLRMQRPLWVGSKPLAKAVDTHCLKVNLAVAALFRLMVAQPLLGIRFIGRGTERGSSRSLTFVTMTNGKDSPLSCHFGRCRLSGTSWEGKVSSVSEAGYDPDGIAEGVPKAWPARKGHCTLESQQVRCSVVVVTGEQIDAQAEL